VSPLRLPVTPEPEPAPAVAAAAVAAAAVDAPEYAPTAGGIPGTEWERLDSDDGMYFYNTRTNDTTWEEPPEVTEAENAAHEALVSGMREMKAKLAQETEEVATAIDDEIDKQYWEPE